MSVAVVVLKTSSSCHKFGFSLKFGHALCCLFVCQFVRPIVMCQNNASLSHEIFTLSFVSIVLGFVRKLYHTWLALVFFLNF